MVRVCNRRGGLRRTGAELAWGATVRRQQQVCAGALAVGVAEEDVVYVVPLVEDGPITIIPVTREPATRR